MSVWDFFERRCSLTVDPAEWEKGCVEFERVGLTNVWKYQALPIDSDQILGPHQSFNATMRLALTHFAESSDRTMLHLEDDCQFGDLSYLEAALAELPSTWDLIYLGCNVQDPPPVRYSRYLWKLNGAWTTHCLAFSRRPIQFILDNQPPYSSEMLDHWLSSQLPNLNAFAISPMIATQRAHHSGLWGRWTDYDEVFRLSQERLDSNAHWITPSIIAVQYIRDSYVDPALDLEIRNLLCECFGEGLFRTQRYAAEMPAHRWLLRSGDGKLIGHIAAHEKAVFIEHEEVRILGVAEVCVHPDHRRGGKLRQMLAQVHEWATGKELVYSVLFGHFVMYASSGYMPAQNLWSASGDENYSEVMVKALRDEAWPHEKQVYLQGPRF